MTGRKSENSEAIETHSSMLLKHKKAPSSKRMGLLINAGDHLISHTLTRAVPSAQRGLTSVFGMGTGVTLAVNSPANFRNLAFAIFHN